MDPAEAFLEVGFGRADTSFALFAQTLDTRWIEEALRTTGAASARRRKLPAEYVVWLVIGMGLFRNRSIEEVVRHLHLVLPGVDPPSFPSVTGGAIVQARDRLGAPPLETLFATTAAAWATASAHAHRWRDLAVYGVDGSHLRVPDTPENDRTVGRPSRVVAAAPETRRCELWLSWSCTATCWPVWRSERMTRGRCDAGRGPVAHAARGVPHHRGSRLSVLSSLPPNPGHGAESALAHARQRTPAVARPPTPGPPRLPVVDLPSIARSAARTPSCPTPSPRAPFAPGEAAPPRTRRGVITMHRYAQSAHAPARRAGAAGPS